MCQLFSGRKDIEIDVSFNLCLDHNKKILDYAIKLETSDFQNYSFAKILDSILQDIQFTGNSLALEIYKDEDNEEPIQTIIINFDSTYEFYSLYNHSSRLCNHELEDLFARLRNFESLEYLNQLDMYDNSIVASLHFNLSQVPFYIGLICNYLTILYPEIDFNCIHTEIIDLSKIK